MGTLLAMAMEAAFLSFFILSHSWAVDDMLGEKLEGVSNKNRPYVCSSLSFQPKAQIR